MYVKVGRAYQVGCWCVWRLWPVSQRGRWAVSAAGERGTRRRWSCSDRSLPELCKTQRDQLGSVSAVGLGRTAGSWLNPERASGRSGGTEQRDTGKLVHIRHERSPFKAKLCSALLIRISSIAKHRSKPIDLSVYLHYSLIRLFQSVYNLLGLHYCKIMRQKLNK